MRNQIAREFAESPLALVTAAAGCGKTQLIAESVKYAKGRQLVLTHTNAGVYVLRARLRDVGVASNQFFVCTIDSFAKRYAQSYPRLSNLDTSALPTDEFWHDVRTSAIRLMERRHIRDVVTQSYTGVFVDEYQDCDRDQHNLILKLAELIDCRIVGDHLQAIYQKLHKDRRLDWNRDVLSIFDNKLGPLETPYRWLNNGNAALGKWVNGNLRASLSSATSTVDIAKPSDQGTITWRPKTDLPGAELAACRALLRHKEQTIVVLKQGEYPCHQLAKQLQGTFKSLETVECPALFEEIDNLETLLRQRRSQDLARFILRFAQKCTTKVDPQLGTILKKIASGGANRYNHSWRRDFHETIETAAREKSCRGIDRVLGIMENRHGRKKLFRNDLWADFRHTLREHSKNHNSTLQEAAINARERRRRFGLRPARRAVARPILVKGLEFDHVLILDADQFDPIELYVAMTRASKSVTILSKERQLKPCFRTTQRCRRRQTHIDQMELFDRN